MLNSYINGLLQPMKKFKQLALNLCLKDTATFANFFVGANKQLTNTLLNLYQNNNIHFIYIWGKSGSGKSHLLSALCQIFSENALIATYLPFEEIKNISPGIFEGLESLDLLCIDDLNLLAGDLIWEEQLFHCFNIFHLL
jgi:DnaA family protein